MKKHFNKNLIMTEEDDFKKSNNCGFVKNVLIIMTIKLEIIVT